MEKFDLLYKSITMETINSRYWSSVVNTLAVSALFGLFVCPVYDAL